MAIKDNKRPIETYEHLDKERINNPPASLVSESTFGGARKHSYLNTALLQSINKGAPYFEQ